jgi:CRISPR/Cas system CSM-associated protein Csm4 (group 5 of RAMP superfamily)
MSQEDLCARLPKAIEEAGWDIDAPEVKAIVAELESREETKKAEAKAEQMRIENSPEGKRVKSIRSKIGTCMYDLTYHWANKKQIRAEIDALTAELGEALAALEAIK